VQKEIRNGESSSNHFGGPPSGTRRSETRRENYQCYENVIDLCIAKTPIDCYHLFTWLYLAPSFWGNEFNSHNNLWPAKSMSSSIMTFKTQYIYLHQPIHYTFPVHLVSGIRVNRSCECACSSHLPMNPIHIAHQKNDVLLIFWSMAVGKK
jgi:hypothetical protein